MEEQNRINGSAIDEKTDYKTSDEKDMEEIHIKPKPKRDLELPVWQEGNREM